MGDQPPRKGRGKGKAVPAVAQHDADALLVQRRSENAERWARLVHLQDRLAAHRGALQGSRDQAPQDSLAEPAEADRRRMLSALQGLREGYLAELDLLKARTAAMAPAVYANVAGSQLVEVQAELEEEVDHTLRQARQAEAFLQRAIAREKARVDRMQQVLAEHVHMHHALLLQRPGQGQQWEDQQEHLGYRDQGWTVESQTRAPSQSTFARERERAAVLQDNHHLKRALRGFMNRYFPPGGDGQGVVSEGASHQSKRTKHRDGGRRDEAREKPRGYRAKREGMMNGHGHRASPESSDVSSEARATEEPLSLQQLVMDLLQRCLDPREEPYLRMDPLTHRPEDMELLKQCGIVEIHPCDGNLVKLTEFHR